MALPQDGQDANGLTKVTQIPAGKELMFIDPTRNEGGIITLQDLTKQILSGITSQAFNLDAGQMTLIQALNDVNRHAIHKIYVEANTKYYIPIPHYFGAIIIGTIGGSRCIIGIFNVPNDPTFFYILGKDSTHPEISVVSDECNESKFTFITPINTAGFVWY